MKYMVFAYQTYYPSGGIHDFMGLMSLEEATAYAAKKLDEDYYEDWVQVVHPETFETVAMFFDGMPYGGGRRMKEIQVTCRWETVHTVEVPDDYEIGSILDEVWADQVDSANASLVDWW